MLLPIPLPGPKCNASHRYVSSGSYFSCGILDAGVNCIFHF